MVCQGRTITLSMMIVCGCVENVASMAHEALDAAFYSGIKTAGRS